MNFQQMQAPHQKDTEEFKLSDLLDTLLQYIWIVIGAFVGSILVGVIYVILATPIYRADALIQVEDKKSTGVGGLREIADALGANSSPVSGEIEIIRSREVVMSAIDTTHADIIVRPKRFPLIGNWWSRRYEPGRVAPAMWGLESYAWGGERLELDMFELHPSLYDREFTLKAMTQGFEVLSEDAVLAQGVPGKVVEFLIEGRPARLHVARLDARPGVEFTIMRQPKIDVYRTILDELSVSEVAKQSSVIRVSYTSSDVDFAQNLVNAIARAYLTQNVERRSEEADKSLKFLEKQLPEIKQEVVRAEDALNAFRTKTNTVSVEKSTDSLLQQAVASERARLELQLKRDELRQRFRPEHPELRAIEAQLAAMNKESANINEQVNRLPQVQRDLLRLQRDAEVANELYVALLNNAQQLKVAKGGTIGNVRIVDFAVRDLNPVAPRKAAIIAICTLLGLLLGVGAAFAARVLRPTVREVSEVERGTGLVSFASIPESPQQEKLDSSKRDRKGREAVIAGRSQLLALIQPDDPAVESLRSLRTGLSFATLGAKNNNIVITGATSALGKSFVSANLSVLLALSGKKVLLVEADMRRPQLGTYFGYKVGNGLSDVLVGQRELEEVLLRDAAGVVGLDVLPSGVIPPNPGELLLTESFSNLLMGCGTKYDYVLIDSPPLLPVGDTLAIARQAATIFMVVRAEVSTLREVRDAVRKLEASGGEVKGIIFNGVKRRRVGYGYAYRYYYDYGAKA
jgi:capsular exopolysaccharide family